MGNDILFRLSLLILLVSFVLHRGNTRRKKSPSPESVVEARDENDLSNRLTALLGMIALLASLTYIFVPSWIAWAQISLPDGVRWMGIPFALFGFALIEYAQKVLGSNWSDNPVLTKEHSLSTSGPYSWIRHPIYTAFLLILSAPLLLSANWLLGFSWILMTYMDVRSRATYEEAILLKRFEEEYKSYAERTGRFLPRIAKPI